MCVCFFVVTAQSRRESERERERWVIWTETSNWKLRQMKKRVARVWFDAPYEILTSGERESIVLASNQKQCSSWLFFCESFFCGRPKQVEQLRCEGNGDCGQCVLKVNATARCDVDDCSATKSSSKLVLNKYDCR